MTWHVQEDQMVELSARAEDSIDDLIGLSYEWSFGVSTEEENREFLLCGQNQE